MNNFDLMDYKNGDIFTTKDGSKYVFLCGASYSIETCNYTIHQRNGDHSPKGKNNPEKRDIVKVERFVTTPDADLISQALKLIKGTLIKKELETIWEREDPEVVAATDELNRAMKALEDAKLTLEILKARKK